jgi:hypothetical protein
MLLDILGRTFCSGRDVDPEAIFVVGVSRSGTTLMRRVLGGHSRIAIATENHYLGHLLPWEGARVYFRSLGDPRDDATMRRIAGFVYGDDFQRRSRLRELSPYWRWLTRTVPREEFERRLLDSDRTERGVFSVLMRTFADHKRKPIMGEKTPAHLAWADTLLEWYPDARIVHMIRDPRAVYVSEVRRRIEHPKTFPYRWLIHVPTLLRAFVLVQVVWAWAVAADRHRRLEARYPGRYLGVRFEDLVREPDGTLRSVCAFLGVDAEAGMLERTVTSKGAMQGMAGFDAGAADRWRASIGMLPRRLIERALSGRMRRLGYR